MNNYLNGMKCLVVIVFFKVYVKYGIWNWNIIKIYKCVEIKWIIFDFGIFLNNFKVKG